MHSVAVELGTGCVISASPPGAAVLVVIIAAVVRAWMYNSRRATVQSNLTGRASRNTKPLRRPHHVPDSNTALLEVLGLIGRNIASGATLSLAIRESLGTAPRNRITEGLRLVDDRAPQIGIVRALHQWGADDPDCRRAAWALAVAAETGGDPLAALDALTDSLRSERALRRELNALTAQSTLSAAVLALVPIGFGALLSGTDERARHFLMATAPGRICLALGLGFDVVAWRWLRSIGSVRSLNS